MFAWKSGGLVSVDTLVDLDAKVVWGWRSRGLFVDLVRRGGKMGFEGRGWGQLRRMSLADR